MLLKVLLLGSCLCLVQSEDAANYSLANNVSPNYGINKEVFPNNFDAVGSFANLVHNYLSDLSKGQPPPDEELCKTHLYNLNGIELKLSARPRGNCTYCCPIRNLLNHVHIHFTNKAMHGETVKLKIIRRKGMLQSVGVDSKLPSIIFVHGFGEHGLGTFSRTILNAHLSRNEDMNVFLVDWGDLTAFPWYPQAVRVVNGVGTLLGKFVKFYNNTGELPISKLHVIGFSLGAHVAGFIGKSLGGAQKIARITGLDPAFPMFPMGDSSQRISKRDAEYVDIIHTDGGKFGFPTPLGHADFYPNGGTYVQPGCELSDLAENQQIQRFGWCSHSRAIYLYAESVKNPNAFPAAEYDLRGGRSRFKRRRTGADVYMGFSANKTYAVGNFYLTTNNHEPFGFGRLMEDQEINLSRKNLRES